MYADTQLANNPQVPLIEEVELLTEEYSEDSLPDNFDHPAADDVWIDSPFWESRELRFDERMARNAILMKWRCGTIDSVIAIMALIAHDALDFDLTIQMISDHALTAAHIDGEAA